MRWPTFQQGLRTCYPYRTERASQTVNLQYVDNAFNELAHINTHIIAVDQDEAGRALRDEMIRRFGAENCKTVSFKDVKDANEYLQKYGYETLRTIQEAQDAFRW